MEQNSLKELLGYQSVTTKRFSEFIDDLIKNPNDYLHTSSSLIAEAIRYYGFDIVVRSGEPIISYNIFKDPFSTGINAVFGQEHCIKHVIDVIEASDNETGLNRGTVLVGPPASGKTNIVDLIIKALEEYTKENATRLHTFFFKFEEEEGRSIEVRSRFKHNPLLLIPDKLRTKSGETIRPRQILFDQIKSYHIGKEEIKIPNFFQNAELDKRTFDIIECLTHSSNNKNKSLYDILDKYVRIEEIELSAAQARGVANIDDTTRLRARTRRLDVGSDYLELLNQHLPGHTLYFYDGAIVDSNRGILHIHDAFGPGMGSADKDYKPLLMLLGSGKVSVESTQTSVDNTVIITTNLEEMEGLDSQIDSSKLLDRIEKIPVNYLLDANSEMDILIRDMKNMKEQYIIDPNLLRIASYYSVLTRLLPPNRDKFTNDWSESKKRLYNSISPEQKLFIYASQNDDPVKTIQDLPHWHPFQNEMLRFGLNKNQPKTFENQIIKHPNAINLRDSELFTSDQLTMIDDEFMRLLWNEHYPNEGRSGISFRQLQNIMRNTIANSDGHKIHVGIFLKQLLKVISEGPNLHHWLQEKYTKKDLSNYIPSRKIGNNIIPEGVGDYCDYGGLVKVVKGIYYSILKKEITVCTVNRDPEQIEYDLRKYLQHALLFNAHENKAFAHVMVPKYAFIDPVTGQKVDQPDDDYMTTIEKILSKTKEFKITRNETTQKFLNLQSSNELTLEDEKTLITSKKDNFLQCFAKEYATLLSYRKADKEINPEHLFNAFFHKKNDQVQFNLYSKKIQNFTQIIIKSMCNRYSYCEESALDTIIFALRKNIVKFERILG
jgi:predicted Ser/Thr protein kinase